MHFQATGWRDRYFPEEKPFVFLSLRRNPELWTGRPESPVHDLRPLPGFRGCWGHPESISCGLLSAAVSPFCPDSQPQRAGRPRAGPGWRPRRRNSGCEGKQEEPDACGETAGLSWPSARCSLLAGVQPCICPPPPITPASV